MVIFSYSRSRSQSTSLHDTLPQALMSVAKITNLCKNVSIVLLAGYIRRGRKSCRLFSVPYDSVVKHTMCYRALSKYTTNISFPIDSHWQFSVFKMLQCYLEKRIAMKESRGFLINIEKHYPLTSEFHNICAKGLHESSENKHGSTEILYLITLSLSLAGISICRHSRIPAFLQHLLKPGIETRGVTTEI